jgi:flagellar hook-length control protein FliK
MPVDADSASAPAPGRDGMRTERLSTAAAAGSAAVDPVPFHAIAAAAGDARADTTPHREHPSDHKASVIAAMSATPAGVSGIDAASTHAVPGAVAASAPAPLDPAAEAELPRQIVQAMRLQWKDGIGDARIRLLPEYLGELSVAIRVEHGSVVAALEASTPAVRQWLESHEPMLRQSLAEQGLHLDRLIVSDESAEAPSQRERRREKGEEQPPPQPRHRPAADDTTFEVIV